MGLSDQPFMKTLPFVLLLLGSVSRSASSPPRRLLHPSLSSSSSDDKYTVIFDAGSTGTRVHVYRFDSNLQLVEYDDGVYEFNKKVTPGLSSYAEDPEAGADSLKPLLEAALSVVPEEKQAETPVQLGATGGLRLLDGDTAGNILEAVSKLLEESPLKFESEWVSILEGYQEGSYSWVTINYLLGNIGHNYSETAASVDLGGASVQMAYAISDMVASNAPAVEGEDQYVNELSVLGTPYHLYVYSYLHYGLLAARAEVLKLVNDSKSCPCIAKGFEGVYEYDSVTYKAVGSKRGANIRQCYNLILKALDVNHSCDNPPCTFGGVWSGGGGAGQKNLYVASNFFDRAMQAGIITDSEAIQAVVKPEDFGKAARIACKLSVEEITELYPTTFEDGRAYFCLDLTYEYALLVNGFGINAHQNITLVSAIEYKDSSVDAQWTLGSAIALLSSSVSSL